MKEDAAQRDSFVVRIWRKKNQPDWQGWVQHSRTGESAPVQNLDELLSFIERWAGKLMCAPRGGLK
jgi:hypothetical protein